MRIERSCLLMKNEVLALRRARGCELQVSAGRAWLTEAGQAGDVFLLPGQAYRVRGSGLLVCECLDDSATVLVRQGRPLSLGEWAAFCVSGLLRLAWALRSSLTRGIGDRARFLFPQP